MPSTATLKRYIFKTRRQLEKQKKKMIYAKELPDKIKAKEEVERLQSKLSWLQSESNRVASDAIGNKKAKGDEREHHAIEVLP